MPELLSPAGNYEKMIAAIHYGADAVYLSGERFGMRAAADNFGEEELTEAVKYAHARGVRVYVTVNTMPREYEYPALERHLRFLGEAKPDALIVADIGVLTLARRLLPDTELHLSTQANTVSAAACRAWHELGAKRIVLSRELTLDEIRAIRDALPQDIELECFVHGSMCISYSGRCLLSNYLCSRDANHGACAQPCRWNYKIRHAAELIEEKRPDEPLPVIEEGGETFFMASRDLSMIEHIPELTEAGISSFKIEGRMKSAYYAAVVTNAYRMAMDAYAGGERTYNPLWGRELESVSHREYDTGFFFCDPRGDAKVTSHGGYFREKAYLATVLSYDEETGSALLVQRNKVTSGMTAEIVSPGHTGRAFTVTELTDGEGNPIPSAPHPGMQFRVTVPFPVSEGDILRGGD